MRIEDKTNLELAKEITFSVRAFDLVDGGYFDTPIDGLNSSERMPNEDFLVFLNKRYSHLQTAASCYQKHGYLLTADEEKDHEKKHFHSLVGVAENQMFWYSQRKTWPNSVPDDLAIKRTERNQRQKKLVETLQKYPTYFTDISPLRKSGLESVKDAGMLTQRELEFLLKGH